MLHPAFGGEVVVVEGVRREGMRAEIVGLPEAQGTWVVACVLGRVTLSRSSVQVSAGFRGTWYRLPQMETGSD